MLNNLLNSLSLNQNKTTTMDPAYLPLILTYFSMEEIFNCQLVCSEWNKVIINNDLLWKDILISQLKEGAKNYPKEDIEINENISLGENETWLSACQWILYNPFEGTSDGQFRNNGLKTPVPKQVVLAMREHDDAGGVIDWNFFQLNPTLLKLYNNSVPVIYHEMALVCAMTPKLVENLYPLWKQLKLERTARNKWKEIKLNEIDVPVITDKEEDGSIFSDTGSPPYRMKWSESERKKTVELLEETLYKEKGWNWIPNWENMKSWAQYWDAGREWWGCYCHTHYSKDMNLLTVSRASTSD